MPTPVPGALVPGPRSLRLAHPAALNQNTIAATTSSAPFIAITVGTEKAWRRCR